MRQPDRIKQRRLSTNLPPGQRVFGYKTDEQGTATNGGATVAPEFTHSEGHHLDDAQEAYTVSNDADLAEQPHRVRRGRSILPPRGLGAVP